MTEGQRRALGEWLPRFELPENISPLDCKALFGRIAPIHVEIGFGNGTNLVAMAAAHPENDYLGIEVHRPGVGRLLQQLASNELTNVRVACRDAIDVLAQVPDRTADTVYLLFPDPWPKLRHHKRRLVSPPFVSAVHRVLRTGGEFCLATDWEDYARQMVDVISANRGFRNLATNGAYVSRPESRPVTRFENRGRRLGHEVRDLAFARVD